MCAANELTPKTRVAAMKVASKFGGPDSLEYNVKTISQSIDKAADQGAKIVVMPETAITGYASQDLSPIWQVPGYPRSEGFKGLDPTNHALEVTPPADSLPGELTVFQIQSAERGIYIVATFLEKSY